MQAPRRLQLRRGNTAAVSNYLGAAGELIVNTDTNTLYIHDGSTIGGFATTVNVTAITNQISSVNANITIANIGMQGYVDLANTIQSQQIATANVGIIGYINSVANQSIYGNSNVKSYLTGGFDGNIIPSANVTYSLGNITHQWRDLFVSNNTIYVGGVPLSIDITGNLTVNGNTIPTIGYVNTAVANVTVDLSSYALNANVTAANVGLKGYVDQANTIQSAQLTSANVGIKGYIDNQIYTNVNVTSYLVSNTDKNIHGNVTIAGNLIVNGNVTYISALNYIIGDNIVNYADGNPADSLDLGFVAHRTIGGVIQHTGLIRDASANQWRLFSNVVPSPGVTVDFTDVIYDDLQVGNITSPTITTINTNITQANVGMKGYVDSQISAGSYGNAQVATYLQFGNIANVSVAGNVTATRFRGNGALLTGIMPVTTNTSANYNIVMATGSNASLVTGSGNGGTAATLNPYTGQMSISGLTIGGYGVSALTGFDYVVTLNGRALTFTQTGNLIVPGNVYANSATITGNVTANYFVGNGALLTGIVAGSNYSNVQVAAYLNTNNYSPYSNVNVAAYLSTATINTTGNITAQYISGNISITGNVTGTSPNVTIQAGAYTSVFDNQGNVTLPSAYITGNVSANYFVGNGALLTGIVAGSNYSNINVATYLPTYSGNVANITLGPSGILTFADGTTQITAGSSSSNYSNVNVAAYISGTSAIFTGNTNTLAAIQANISQVFIGNSTALTSGSGQNTFFTYLLNNIYYDAAGLPRYRNAAPGAASLYMAGTGFQFAGQNSTVTANASAAGIASWATITSSGISTFNSASISAAGNLSAALGGLNTTATQAYLYNATATTINMGGAATTIRMGTNTSNVFVGRAIGNANRELLLRAQGTWNTAINIDSNGGFNSPPYTNQLVIGGSGTGMTANYNATGGYLNSVTIYNPGTGYQNGDVLSVPGGIAGNSFTLTNYSSTLTGNSAAAYTFGIEGNLTVPGNVTARNFIGSGALLTSLPGYAYSNVNVTAYTESMGYTNYSNVNVAAFTSGLTNYSNVNLIAYLSSVQSLHANIKLAPSGNIVFADGTVQTTAASGGGSNYGNANVAAYLPTYTGTTGITQVGTLATLNVTGNTTVGNLIGTEANTRIIASTYVSTFDIYGNVSLPNVYVAGNVVAARFIGDGSLLTGIVSGGGSSYGNSNVAQYLQVGGVSNISVAGNVTATYFIGNGALLTGIAASSNYSNVQVATYLPTYSGNIVAANVWATGNATGSGALTIGPAGYTVLPTTITQFTGNANTYTQLNLQNISTGSDATAEYVATANNGTDTTFFVDMGIANSNYDVNSPNNSLGTTIYPNDSYLYAQGNLATTTGGNLAIGTSTAGKSVKIFAGGINSGNIVATVSNTGVAVTGSVSATANVSAVNMTASGNVNVTGYVVTSGGYGNISQVDYITANNVIATANVTVQGIGVTMPNRPAFRVYGSTQGVPQTLTANVNLKGNAIVTQFNQGNYFNATTGQFIAPVAGIYSVGLNARVGTNNGLNQLAVLKNGVNTTGNVVCFWESDTNTGTAVHFGVNGTVILAVGDYLAANILAGNISFDQNDNWHVTYLG